MTAEWHKLAELGRHLEGTEDRRAGDAVDQLLDLLGNDQPAATPTEFLAANLCRIPLTQQVDAGLSVVYLKALDVLTGVVCNSQNSNLNDWCIRRKPVPEFGAANSNDFATQTFRGWLKATGFDTIFGDSVRIREVGSSTGGSDGRMYWLTLRPRESERFGERWDRLSDEYAKKTDGDSLDERVALAFAASMNVYRERVAVYVDNYCDDLRIRILRGHRAFRAALRCRYDPISIDKDFAIDVDKLVQSFVASHSISVRSGKLTWLETVVGRQFRKLGGTPNFYNEDESFNETEFLVTGLRGRVTGDKVWEHLSGFLQLRPLGTGEGYKVRLRSVYGQWASGSSSVEPKSGYSPMDGKSYNTALKAFLPKLLNDVAGPEAN